MSRFGFALSVVLVGCTSDPEAEPAVVRDAAAEVDGSTDTGGTDTASEAIADAPKDTADTSCKLVKAYSSKNAKCNACAEAKCCAEINGCLGDPKCDDEYVNCILACALLPADAGDAGAEAKACIAKCGADFPVGKVAYDKAIGCADGQCGAECG